MLRGTITVVSWWTWPGTSTLRPRYWNWLTYWPCTSWTSYIFTWPMMRAGDFKFLVSKNSPRLPHHILCLHSLSLSAVCLTAAITKDFIAGSFGIRVTTWWAHWLIWHSPWIWISPQESVGKLCRFLKQSFLSTASHRLVADYVLSCVCLCVISSCSKVS